ncbi:hypothetical protein HBA92_09845 [Ochrobactrum sp. MR28]|nr:hypothetical protein [Ochrobactrum sp. MR28]MBX8816882.1 hypothetical protein [Ochrobactrum sp. MR31]
MLKRKLKNSGTLVVPCSGVLSEIAGKISGEKIVILIGAVADYEQIRCFYISKIAYA